MRISIILNKTLTRIIFLMPDLISIFYFNVFRIFIVNVNTKHYSRCNISKIFIDCFTINWSNENKFLEKLNIKLCIEYFSVILIEIIFHRFRYPFRSYKILILFHEDSLKTLSCSSKTFSIKKSLLNAIITSSSKLI